ncbi:hypothetical protein SPAR168_0482 [Streptococcus pneumoniae GA62681]|nr:hypothetical protein SPAR168_0482 [Streptococcus pneumoniae GA62681]
MHFSQQLVRLAKYLKRARNDMMCFQKFLNRRFNSSLLGKIIL